MSFHDLSKFSIANVKQLCSKYCQNNLLFKVFSHILTHKIRAGIKTGFLTRLLYFQLLIFLPQFYSSSVLCVVIIKLYIIHVHLVRIYSCRASQEPTNSYLLQEFLLSGKSEPQ